MVIIMTSKITFDITDNGIVVDSEGFKGNTCLKELESLKSFLKTNGGIDMNVTDQKKKPSFYQPAEGNKSGSVI
jgi:fatty acid/phospholipid biosynthesis enzyme